MTAAGRSPSSVALRNGVEIANPLEVALGFLGAYSSYDTAQASSAASFGEDDLRLANRGGARISAAEIAAILERRGAIQSALHRIPPDSSLTARARAVPWRELAALFEAFADIRGVGFSKMTKTLHRKRPALIPILDSVVQAYLAADDAAASSGSFGERATALVRSYKHDLDSNAAALRELRQQLASRDYRLSEVRILDVLIWSASVPASQATPSSLAPSADRTTHP